MAVIIGTNTVTAIARHFIMPTITDNIYQSNVLLYRLMKMNKRLVYGGEHIELPLLYQRFNTGGPYRGLDVFSTAPSDTVKNAAFDWKQHYVTWSVDGLTMIKVDSADAIANFLVLQSQQAYMEMAENLAVGLFNGAAANIKDLDGLADIFSLTNTYGGLSRTTNTWWQPYIQGGSGASVAMTMALLKTLYSGPQRGGFHPTIFLSDTDQYNRFWGLNAGTAGYSVQNVRQPGGHDELLASAGFTNLLFDNVPWVTDSHVPDATTINASATGGTSLVYALNENMFQWIVSPRADFYLKPFVEPHNQDAMVASLLFAGNFVTLNSNVQGVAANFT